MLHKEIKGKEKCSSCGKTNPPIREVAIRMSKRVTLWYDICAECIAEVGGIIPIEKDGRARETKKR